MWNDGEQVRTELFFPLPTTPWAAGQWTLRGWRQVAEHHVVDGVVAPHSLTEGVPKGELYRLGRFWCASSPESHVGPFLNAIDFLVPDGTPVLAAADGVIVEIIDHHADWGESEEFRDQLNYVTILHDSGEMTQYCHLAPGSVRSLGLRVGSRVKCGERIATVGKTGWTDRDHLHFLVFRLDDHPDNPFGFKSLRVEFRRRY